MPRKTTKCKICGTIQPVTGVYYRIVQVRRIEGTPHTSGTNFCESCIGSQTTIAGLIGAARRGLI